MELTKILIPNNAFMDKINRRSALQSMGVLSLGVAAPGLAKGVQPAPSLPFAEQNIETDVLVIGGGTSGTIAALQSARTGARTILLENGSQLGGVTTTGGVSFPGIFHAWGKQVISGPGWELVQECVKMNGDELPDFSIPHLEKHWKHQVRINGPLYALIAEQKCLEAGVRLRFYETPLSIDKTGHGWMVRVAGKGTLASISCNQLVDCTGNALLTGMAGFKVLRESEIQPGTLMFKLEGYETESLDLEKLEQLFTEEVERGTISREEYYNFRGLLLSYGDNAQHIRAADSSTSVTHSQANIAGRSSLFRLLSFLKTLPGLEKLKLADMQTEIAARESFRIDGICQISHSDYVSGKVFEDAVSYSYYPIDLHTEEGVEPAHLQEGRVASIPLRALIPKGSENFIVAGRCVSSDRLANSALRVQASCMGMGQAAGAAAALASQLNTTPEKLDLPALKKLIAKHGGIVPGLNDN